MRNYIDIYTGELRYQQHSRRFGINRCPDGNGIWYHETPTYSWDGESPHYRTKSRYPYNYDPFFVVGSHRTIKDSSADYTDRYVSWDIDKFQAAYDAIGRKVNWSHMILDDVDKFVKAYYGPEYKATGLVEWCNASSGYPHWSIHFKKAKK